MKKLTLAGIILSLLTACATSSKLNNTKNKKNVYPVRNIIENLYINGWKSHVKFENSSELGQPNLEMLYSIDAYDKHNPNIVDYYGKKAIKVNATDTIITNGESSPLNMLHFYDINSHRLLGVKCEIFNTKFDKLYPLPNYAHTNQVGLLNEGTIKDSSKEEGKIKEIWSLKKINDQLANLCIISDKKFPITKNIQHWQECYTIDQKGKILSQHETGSLFIAKTGQTNKFATINKD